MSCHIIRTVRDFSNIIIIIIIIILNRDCKQDNKSDHAFQIPQTHRYQKWYRKDEQKQLNNWG